MAMDQAQPQAQTQQEQANIPDLLSGIQDQFVQLLEALDSSGAPPQIKNAIMGAANAYSDAVGTLQGKGKPQGGSTPMEAQAGDVMPV